MYLSVDSVLFHSIAVANMSKVTFAYFCIVKLKWNINSPLILVPSKIPLHKFSLSQPDLFLSVLHTEGLNSACQVFLCSPHGRG